MAQDTIEMVRNKKIALVAHDNKKEELFEWAKRNCKLLAEHSLYATGTTGQLLKSRLGLNVTHLESGPLGGDQQLESQKARLTLSSSSRTHWSRKLTMPM
jgi:methylglyoxal synthase